MELDQRAVFAGFDQFVTGEGNPEELGVQLITGLLNGIWSVIKGIWDWIYKNIFKPIGEGIADAFDMHSPSRVAEGWAEHHAQHIERYNSYLDEKSRHGWTISKTVYLYGKVSNALRPIINGIIGFMNGMISGVVSGMNAVIDVLNHLNVHIPDWVPLFGGKSIGFSLTPITAPQIPMLAQGAVIPPNREFLAVLGDQTSGTNIEAPASLIKQMVEEALAEAGASGEQEITINLTTLLDGEVVYKNQERIVARRGRRVVGNPALL